ncbi:MAG: iron-containing alcohol dehydrogenase [Lachnospiraceae bacterium]|nr:iron-containing alcohol dehydrogenase [Lachnospiraceae bacterium]
MKFEYYLPVNLIFGAGATDKAGTITKKYGSKALIVTGGSSAKKSGLYDKVKDLLKAEGIDSVLFDKVKPNPLTTTAIEGASLAKSEKCDVVVAIGGGSIMDCAKGIAFAAVNDGDISDYIYKRKFSDDALPLVLIPTTCGTGSEGNGFAVLTNPDNGDKKSLRCNAIVAKASIIDPLVMKTMPKKVLASVGFDALCHNIEAFTTLSAQPFTDALALYAMPLIIDVLPKLYSGDDSLDNWEKMSLASTIGGMVINNAGCGLAHGMEHPASGLKDIVHGMGLAAIEPVAVDACCKGDPDKFQVISKMLGGTTATDCGKMLREFLAKIDLTLGLKDLGIEDKDIPWMARNCMKVSAGNLSNIPVSFDEAAIADIYKKCM